MAQRASELIADAEENYGRPLTPEITEQIRGQLQAGIAETLGLYANIIMCDYLNRWNNADERNLDVAQIAVDTAKYYADVAIAHYAQDFIYRARGTHPEAETAFQESWNRNPNSVRARAQWAAEMSYNGKFGDALREIEAAITDGATSPALGMFQWIKGRTQFFMADYKSAISSLRDSVDNWSNSWYSWLYLVSAYALDGNNQAAQDVLAEFNSRFQGYDTIAQVMAAEQTNPNENADIQKGRAAFHEGLASAGMPWK